MGLSVSNTIKEDARNWLIAHEEQVKRLNAENTEEGSQHQIVRGSCTKKGNDEYSISLHKIEKLDKYLFDARKTLEMVQAALNESDAKFVGAEEQRKVSRGADLKYFWRLWLERSARWIFGAVLVVVLYSSFVWASERCDFIKIPLRDVFKNNAPTLKMQPKLHF